MELFVCKLDRCCTKGFEQHPEALSIKSSVVKRTFVFFFSFVSYGLGNNDVFMFNESFHCIKPNEWNYPNEYGVDYLGFSRENLRFHDTLLSPYRIVKVGDNC